MKTKQTSKSAFTLVEMLVVIAIISLVAMAVTRAVKGAQRTANTTKCQANLKNLHTAVMGYFADTGHYPLASSYETITRNQSGKVFEEHQGWVSWVPKDGSKRRDDSGKTPWKKSGGNEKSHADKFYFPANTDPNMRQAITEGSLYKYVGKDPMSYCCPQHRVSKNGKKVFLSYAMNSWFFSHSYLHESYSLWKRVKDGFPVRDSRRPVHFTSKTQYIPSRMALFIEMEDCDDNSGGGNDRTGQAGDSKQHARILVGDCVWEWWDQIGLEKGAFDLGHFKGKVKYCNIVFLDGHVQAIAETQSADTDVDELHGHNKNDVFKTLGNGSY